MLQYKYVNHAIHLLFPNMVYNTQDLIQDKMNYINYVTFSNFIIILIGILNYKLKQLGIDIKFALKGGKAAQMLISKYARDIIFESNDVDILVLSNDSKHNAKNITEQLSEIINNYISYDFISILKPNQNPENPNIIKISLIRYSGRGYIPLSDIDFKQPETDFFNDLEENSKYYVLNYIKEKYRFELLYYHQSPKSFIDEKEYYLKKYSDPIQTKGTLTCNCSNTNQVTHECSKICNYKTLIQQKFSRYVDILNFLKRKKR